MSTANSPTRRWMTPPPVYENTRPGTTLKPYLTLPYILSLTWLAYPILSLLFVVFRLQISSASAQDAVSDAKGSLSTSCNAAEKAATAAASLPRYMAQGSNKQIADAVNGTMNAARATLVLSLTILEGVINFVIDIYRSTFFCFLELVVRGGLSVLIGAVQEINSFLSSTFSSIRISIQNDVSDVNSAIASAIDAINKVNPFGNISVPQFDIPSLSALENVTLPSDFEDALLKLNSSLPTLDQVREAIESVVDTPFEDLKADINNTFAGISFNASTLPVPDQQTLSFCGDLDTSVVDDLGKDLLKAAKIGTIVLILLLVLLLAAHCALEWYKWRCLQNHLEYTRQAWVSDPTMNNSVQGNGAPSLVMTDHNLLMLSADLQHPLLTRIANRLSAIFKLTPSQFTNLSWFFHYVFHPPVLACFLIGFFGILSVEMQLLAVKPLEAKYTQEVSSSISDFSNTIATSINASMYNQSASYANQINSQVDTVQSTINDGLFGWVNGTTTTLNTTLVNFYSDIQNAVSTVFNGTVLESPIQEFVNCIIGTKVTAIENALTFLHDNLVIDIPRVNESVLVLSQADIDEATRPISEAAVGSGNDDSDSLVGRLIARYVSSLKEERIMFGIFLALWGLVVVMALLIIFWHSYVKPVLEKRGRKKYLRGQRNFPSFILPYKPDLDSHSSFDEKKEKPVMVMNNLAPTVLSPQPQQAAFHDVNLRTTPGRQSLQNGESKEGPPQKQRSWDSFLDASMNQAGIGAFNVQPDVPVSGCSPTKEKRVPRKLTAIGRKAMGRERFVSDEERDRMREEAKNQGAEEEQEQGGWMKRLTTAFRKTDKSESDGLDSSSSSNGSSSSLTKAKKPNLTISTNIDFSKVSRDRLPTASEDVPIPKQLRSPMPGMENANVIVNVPPSAWSISPGPTPTPVAPRALPWLTNPLNVAGKRPKAKPKPNVPGLPLSPRHGQARRTRAGSVPLSASVYGPPPSTPAAAMTTTSAVIRERERDGPQTPFFSPPPPPPTRLTPMASGVPSYYHTNLPHYAGRESLLPENAVPLPIHHHHTQRHKRTSSVPLSTMFPPSSSSARRESRLHARRQSSSANNNAVNPFSTPFDDEARVADAPDHDHDRTARTDNPFSPVAV